MVTMVAWKKSQALVTTAVKISKKRVEHIVHEYLDMQKLFAK
jgi:hypothetical protein